MHYENIGILGAMPEEVNQVMMGLEETEVEEYAGVAYHKGRRAGRRLVVCCAGMGKVNAASTTQVLITKFGVDAIIFSGIAGNTSSEISVGDVVIGKEVVHHDAEERMLKQSAPYTASYGADPLLLDAVEQGCRLVGVRYIVGRIATGEQFVGDPDTKRRIIEKCAPDCVEMEGAAVAQVAMRNRIPFVVLRAMSDNSDVSVESLGAEAFDVSEYVTTASAIVVAAVDALKGLGG